MDDGFHPFLFNHMITKNSHQIPSKDNTLISYQHSGTGQPLLFVHGTTADHLSWFQVSSLLERDFSVYSMDRRGRGANSQIVSIAGE